MEEKKMYSPEEVLNLQSVAYQKGLNEGYELCKKEHPEAVWMKATSRLPLHKAFWNIEDGFKKDCSFPVRIDGNKYGMAELYDERKEGDPDPIYCFTVKGDADYFENYFHRLEWLDESGTANALPTFWDVAKAFKWAAEYNNEKGEQLSLLTGQWTLIREDEENENETEDITPGNVAELYCLQNGFTKEIDGTATPNNEQTGEWSSNRLAGRVKERFKELEEKQHDWRSFYNGWLEGRSDMLSQIRGWGKYKK